jgi:sugar phosphate isomerase/epimerase
MTHQIGLAALTVLELTPPDMVSCAAAAGFDCIGLRLIPATVEEVQHAMVGDTPLVRETERRLKETGIRCLDIEIFRLKPDTSVADYEAALETSARFGAREALIAGNDPDETRLTENFAAFGDLARPYGIGINLEPMPWTDCKNPFFAAFLRTFQSVSRSQWKRWPRPSAVERTKQMLNKTRQLLDGLNS